MASGTPFPDRLFDRAKPTANGRARARPQASSRGARAVLAGGLAAAIRLTRAATTGVIGWHRRRAVIRELEALDDRLLADVGYHRGALRAQVEAVSAAVRPSPVAAARSVEPMVARPSPHPVNDNKEAIAA